VARHAGCRGDLDLDDGLAYISRQLQEDARGRLKDCPLKTDSSRRAVALDPGTVLILRAHRSRQRTSLGEDAVAAVADGTVQDAISAIDAAAQAAPAWAATAPRERDAILRRAYQLMTESADELARLISQENGNALPDALGEVRYAAEFFRWYSEEAVRVNGTLATAPSGTNKILVQYRPGGHRRRGHRCAGRATDPQEGGRRGVAHLREIGPRLLRLGVAVGANLLLSAAYAVALIAALRSVGAHPAILAAGLTAIGITAHEAIPAVLLFRMATFWVPIPAGWISYLMLQRRGIL
jgi:hypothetical protein